MEPAAAAPLDLTSKRVAAGAPPPGAWPAVAGVAAYLALVVAAVVLFRTPGLVPAGNELSLSRCVFTVCNAASLTGFEQTIAVDTYRTAGKVVILVLTIAGSLLSLTVGGAAVVRLARLPYSFAHVARAAVIVELFAVSIGAAALVGPQRGLFAAAFQAASAFGNSGVVIGPPPGIDRLVTHLFVLPLAFVGGLGLPVLMELVDRVRVGRRISFYSRTVLVCLAGVYLAGFATLILLKWPAGSAVTAAASRELLIDASATTLNARSLGWPVQSPATWPRAVQWFALVLMIVGAAPAGTGGGLKVTCIPALVGGVRRTLRGSPGGRPMAVAVVWVALYLTVLLVTTVRLSASEPQLASDQVLFVAASALGNAGLAYAPISITGDGLYTVSAAMLLGRLLPLAILWWAALTSREPELPVA